MAGSSSSDFTPRLVSTLVLAPLVVFFAWLGGVWFAALIVLVCMVAYWEWTVMTVRSVDIRRDAIACACILCLSISVAWTPSLIPAVIVFFIASLGIALIASGRRFGWTLTGLAISSMLAVSLIFIRQTEPNGLEMLVFVSFTVWAADIFAYLIGRSVGGPKLMPSVSPNKTWSGFLGGLFGAVMCGSLVASIFFDDQVLALGMMAVILALFAQAGDLMESYVKRTFQVKDTSNLIPGHGGVLDRIDGLSVAAYAFVFIYAMGLVG